VRQLLAEEIPMLLTMKTSLSGPHLSLTPGDTHFFEDADEAQRMIDAKFAEPAELIEPVAPVASSVEPAPPADVPPAEPAPAPPVDVKPARAPAARGGRNARA
jgi:hypothetical protein